MRTTFRTLSAAFLAALFALASCDKSDIAGNDVQQQTGGSRVIAVSFQNNSTKTILDTDGLTPKFEANDQIKVSNGSATEVCTVSVEGDVATITTSLTGTLTAVYPATAAKMNSENPNKIDGVLVPTEQSGKFEDANICKATIAGDATSATFENQTAVFKITPGAGSDTYVDLVAPHGKEIANVIPEGSAYNCDSKHKIHVAGASASTVYISILVPEGGLQLSALTFADRSGIRPVTATDAVAVNTMYTVTGEGWSRPYVEIGGLKWATMNVGATTVAGCHCTSYGDYFAWGETEPYYSSISFSSASSVTNTWKTSPKDYSTDGYVWTNYKYCNGTSKTLTKYCDNSTYGQGGYTDSKTVLDPADDAATQNWGPSWRMPTKEEFKALYTACTDNAEGAALTALPESITGGGVYWLSADQEKFPEYSGVAGVLFVDKTDQSKRVFFPAAGSVSGASFNNGGTLGYYWSGSLSTGDPRSAWRMTFSVSYVSPSSNSNYRYIGFLVRPLSE